MSNSTAAAPSRSRKARLFGRIVIAALVGVFALLGIGLLIRNHYEAQGEKRYQEAVAGLDRQDPRWHWEDILTDRAAVPDEQNAAPTVLAAAALLPTGQSWMPRRSPPPVPVPVGPPEQGSAPPGPPEAAVANEQPPLEEEIAARSPAERLDSDQTAELRAGLEKLRPALQAARPLADRTTGRYLVEWRKDFLSTLLPHLQKAREVCRLLLLDAVLAAEDGDIEQALVSCRAAFNAGRSIGDEPTLISLLVRIACGTSTVRTVERVLAQGTCSPETLAVWQRLLEQEAAEPLLWRGLRGERASMSEVIGQLKSGELHIDSLEGTHGGAPSLTQALVEWAYVQPMARTNQATFLELMTRALEAESLPPAEQRQVFQAIEAEVRAMKRESPQLALMVLVMPSVLKVAEATCRHRSELHCARLALAAERYRLAHGAWPEALPQLAGEFLTAVPPDLFGDGPLHLKRTPDGLVIYSVGSDGVDNGGDVARTQEHPQPADLGFRLWDPAKRRQPPVARPEPEPAGRL